MAGGGTELPTSPSSSTSTSSSHDQIQNGPLLSQHVLIGLISLTFILVVIYPWLIAVTVISFAFGFTCVEHLDRLVKSSISGGRFGSNVQAFFKEYINEREVTTTAHKTSIKEVNVDPLRDYLEVNESRKGSVQSQSSEGGGGSSGNKHGIQIHHSLAIPEELIPNSSNRSSPERTRSARDSPILNLSAASSRRVSEEVLSSTLGGGNNVQVQQHHWRESNNKTSSPSKSSNAGSTPSPSLALSSEISTLRVDKEFRVDARIDLAFGKLFTNILNYYISPSWAPYETRRQLRLSFKQLLTTVAEHLNKRLLICKGDNEYPPLVKITRQKLVPLLLHYLDKILARGLSTNDLDEPIISKDSRRRIILKIRKFCRQISQKFLNKDDQNCKLWMELVIAVLADGVLVNVINLGRDKLPELFEELVTNYKKTPKAATTSRVSSPSPAKSVSSGGESSANNRHHSFVDPLSDNYSTAEEANFQLAQQHKEETTSERSADFSSVGGDCNLNEMAAAPTPATLTEKVPFLLDSFLDPPFNLDKPDPIVSRWRPTLKDIVSETDLLYPLIQYMKHVGGQQSLVYLQGVLDDYPQEGDPYCRRVLELEYLPGFCRSSLLLETMGLNRVEMALEVGADLLNMRRNSNGGHARSASYGGPASSSSSFREFLKIERGIVDGLPLTESSGHLSSLSSSSSEQSGSGVSSGGGTTATAATLPGAGAIEPSLAFKRRPHLEMYIAKFIKSTTKSWKQYYDPLAEKLEPVKRAGIDGKSYEEWDHPEVNSRVRIYATNEDIYDSLVELVTNLMRNSPLASPFLSGLTHFLKPYLMPVFDSQIDKNLSRALSVDLLILVVDLIAEVFEESPDDMNIEENHKPNDDKHDNGDDDPVGSTSQSPFKVSKSGLLSDDDVVSNPEDDTSHHHNSSCTTCDPSFKSTFKSFLLQLLERFTLNLIDLDHFVKCCKKNREYIFLFFVDLLDVLVSELVEK